MKPNFDPSTLIPHFRYFDRIVSAGVGVNTEIAPYNPNRVWFLLKSNTNSAWIRFGSPAKTNGGAFMNTQPFFTMSFADAGVCVMQSVNLFETAALNVVYFAEVWYVP